MRLVRSLRSRFSASSDAEAIDTDARTSDSQLTESTTGRALSAALDRAVRIQESTVTAWVSRLSKKHPQASHEELQDTLNTQFLRAATGSGATVGTTSAIPGIGLVTGAAAVAGESVVFLDLTTLYIMASAQLRGADLSEPEARRLVVLTCLLGAQGTALLDVVAPDSAKSPVKAARRLSPAALADVNNRLLRVALKRVASRTKVVWLGRLLPLGIGVYLGARANRKLAQQVISHTEQALETW